MNPAVYALLLLALSTSVSETKNSERVVNNKKLATAAPAWMILATVFLAVFLFMVLGRLTVIVAAIIVAATVAYSFNNARKKKMNVQAEDAIARLLGNMTADLRAGASFPAALKRGAEDLAASSTTSMEMKTAIATAAVIAHRGGSVSTVLATSHPQLKTLGALCTLSEKHGIPLSDVFEQAHNHIEARKRHRAATKASLQGPQATAIVLTLLPLAGILMGTIMGANPVGFLLGGGIGGVLLVIGVALACAGFSWSRTLVANAES